MLNTDMPTYNMPLVRVKKPSHLETSGLVDLMKGMSLKEPETADQDGNSGCRIDDSSSNDGRHGQSRSPSCLRMGSMSVVSLIQFDSDKRYANPDRRPSVTDSIQAAHQRISADLCGPLKRTYPEASDCARLGAHAKRAHRKTLPSFASPMQSDTCLFMSQAGYLELGSFHIKQF